MTSSGLNAISREGGLSMQRLFLYMVTLALLLSACAQGTEKSATASPMLHLQLLLTQSASLATLPGDAARKHALELARRAMSGPEMNAMHHGGGADQPMMKATHDLGDAIFELLDVAPQAIANPSLQLAAQAAQMRLSGKLLMDEAAVFMRQQGQALKHTSPNTPSENSAYDKAASRLLSLLRKIG